MPGKKKKYNARFPPARIKKIMQTDEEVGKVAQAVPVIISRALELFADNLLNQANKVTLRRGARTLTPSHLKFCIENERKFDFLRDMVAGVPDLHDDDLEMEVDVIPIQPPDRASIPKPLSTTNGRSQSNDNIFKEPESRESTPGSPSNPSPVSTPSTLTNRGSTPTSTSSRGGATPKRRGRPPKQNGSLGRSFPPMPGDKRKLSDDTSSWIQEAGYRVDSKPTCSESSSLPGSPLIMGMPPLQRANSHQGTNGRNPSTSSGSPASSSSSGSRDFNTSRNQNYNHQHHTTAWSSGSKLAGGLSRSNSTPTGFVFSVSPIEETVSSPGSSGSAGGPGTSTTPSFTINVNPDLTATQAAGNSSSGGHQSSSRGSSGHHSSYLPPSTSLNANSNLINSLARADPRSISKSINSINKGDKKFGATTNNTLVKPPARQMSVIHPPVRAGGGNKKHNGQKSAGHKNDFKLYPRDNNKGVNSRDTGGGYNQSDRLVGVVKHPRDVGSEGVPMDLSKDGPLYTGGGEEEEPSLLEDLSRLNAFNTQGPGSAAGTSSTATFSRLKPLDEDYDC